MSDERQINNNDLLRVAAFLSGRMKIRCGKCNNYASPRVEDRTIRIGSSPDLTGLDSTQNGKPRINFLCPQCRSRIGFVQGDLWVDAEPDIASDSTDTRFDYLELDESHTRN